MTDSEVPAIRRATAEDWPALSDLRWTWATADDGPPEGCLTRPEFDAVIAPWVREQAATHTPYLAEVAGEAVGMAWLASLPRVPDPTAARRIGGDLQSVYVRPPWRGRGVGAALVAAVLAEAAARGYTHVTVRSGRRSLDFYRRLGFAPNDHTLELRVDRAGASE